MSNTDILFQPFALKSLTLPNRIVMRQAAFPVLQTQNIIANAPKAALA